MRGGFLLILGSAALIGFFYRDLAGESFIDSVFQKTERASINEALAESARSLNRNLPIKDKKGREWLSVSASDMRMIYFYKYTSHYPSRKSMYESTRNGVCADPHTRKMLDNGVTLEYVYVNGTNLHLFQYSMSGEDCIVYSENQAHRVLPKVTAQISSPTPSSRLIDGADHFGIVNEYGGSAIISGNLEPLRSDMRKGLLDRDNLLAPEP